MTLLFALLAASQGASPAPETSVPSDAAIIVNSGSTNTQGFRIVVRPDRSAIVTIGTAQVVKKELTAATTQAFFKDLGAAGSLDKLEHEPCMKSASFGTTTRVTYKGNTTPDLSCASGESASNLNADIAKIRTEAGVGEGGSPLFRHFVQPTAAPSPATD
jgi:hypothetical protein